MKFIHIYTVCFFLPELLKVEKIDEIEKYSTLFQCTVVPTALLIKLANNHCFIETMIQL